MNYKVIVRTTKGQLITEHRCATPMDGLSWLAASFQARQGFEDVAEARCYHITEMNVRLQWELQIS